MNFIKLAACLPLLSSSLAFAWGWQGHGITAIMAQKILQADTSPEAKTALATVKSILGEMPLDRAASWSDQVKDLARKCKQHPYVSDPKHSNPKSSPICDAYKATSSWHFVSTTSTGYVYNPADKAFDRGDLYSIIRALTIALSGRSDSQPVPASFTNWLTHCQRKADRPCKQEALSHLLHYVADVHQPMHAGDTCDVGGNGQLITVFGEEEITPTPKYCETQGRMCPKFQLHSTWDSGLLVRKTPNTRIPFNTIEDYANRLYAKYSTQSLKGSSDPAQCVKAAPTDFFNVESSNYPADWINESLCYMNQVYSFPDMQPAQPTPRCSPERKFTDTVNGRTYTYYTAYPVAQKYYDANIVTIQERVYWSAHRMATVMKSLFGHGDKSKVFAN